MIEGIDQHDQQEGVYTDQLSPDAWEQDLEKYPDLKAGFLEQQKEMIEKYIGEMGKAMKEHIQALGEYDIAVGDNVTDIYIQASDPGDKDPKKKNTGIGLHIDDVKIGLFHNDNYIMPYIGKKDKLYYNEDKYGTPFFGIATGGLDKGYTFDFDTQIEGRYNNIPWKFTTEIGRYTAAYLKRVDIYTIVDPDGNSIDFPNFIQHFNEGLDMITASIQILVADFLQKKGKIYAGVGIEGYGNYGLQSLQNKRHKTLGLPSNDANYEQHSSYRPFLQVSGTYIGGDSKEAPYPRYTLQTSVDTQLPIGQKYATTKIDASTILTRKAKYMSAGIGAGIGWKKSPTEIPVVQSSAIDGLQTYIQGTVAFTPLKNKNTELTYSIKKSISGGNAGGNDYKHLDGKLAKIYMEIGLHFIW